MKREELPKTYEEFAKRPQWAGKVAIDVNDETWLATIYEHYGEAKAKAMMGDIVKTLKPVIIQGHLAVARAVGAGEYWIALNNFLNLTLNVKLAGQPTDFWVLDPVSQQYGQVGISANSPNPNAARLAVNFMLSQESQQFLANVRPAADPRRRRDEPEGRAGAGAQGEGHHDDADARGRPEVEQGVRRDVQAAVRV